MIGTFRQSVVALFCSLLIEVVDASADESKFPMPKSDAERLRSWFPPRSRGHTAVAS